MKFPIVIIYFFICTISATDSFSQHRSNLYMKVDSIIRYELHFNIDSAQHFDKQRSVLVYRDAISSPTYPLIFLDEKLIEIADLEHYQRKNIRKYEVVKPSNAKAAAIYGSRGSKGVIFVYSDKFKRPIRSFFSY